MKNFIIVLLIEIGLTVATAVGLDVRLDSEEVFLAYGSIFAFWFMMLSPAMLYSPRR